MLLLDFRNVTTENFSSKMEELVKHIKLVTEKGIARKTKIDIDGQKSTISVIQKNIPRVAWSSSSRVEVSTSQPVSTIADLSQRLVQDRSGTLEDAAADAAAEVLRDIVLGLKQDERSKFLPTGIVLTLCCPLIFPMTLGQCIQYHQRISFIDRIGHGKIQHMLRIEGEQWVRYVEHIFAESRRSMTTRACRRLLARGYGHVLIGPNWILLDALLCMAYENVTAVRHEIIKAPNKIDMMLRVWFFKRNLNIQTDMGNDPMKFDIFLPPQMDTEELLSIVNHIMLESKSQRVF